MFKKKYKKVLVEKLVDASAVCDNCGKVKESDDIPIGWHQFSSGHSEWGNNSIDSYRDSLACSAKCWLSLVRKKCYEWEGFSSTEIDGMDITFANKLVREFYKEEVEQ